MFASYLVNVKASRVQVKKKIPRLSLSREERSIFRMPPDTHAILQFLIFHQVVQQVIIIVILYKAS